MLGDFSSLAIDVQIGRFENLSSRRWRRYCIPLDPKLKSFYAVSFKLLLSAAYTLTLKKFVTHDALV